MKRRPAWNIPDTAPAHELDGYQGRGTLAVNPLPPKAPTPIIPVSVPVPGPRARTTIPRQRAPCCPQCPIMWSEPLRAHMRRACITDAPEFPGALGWSGPYGQRNYGVWAYVYAEDCRVPGYLLGLRGGVAHNLQWIVTVFYWNGYQPVFWYDVTNPEASGTDNEIGCTGSSVFCQDVG